MDSPGDSDSTTIVVPTFNNRDVLADCLGALSRCAGGFAVYVCVDGSTDDTLEFLASRSWPFPLRVLEHTDRENHGRAAARNLALPHLESEFVLLLDSDMRLAPGAIAAHLDLLRGRDCVSVGDVVCLNARENRWARYLGTRGKNKAAAGAEIRPLDFVTANSAMRTKHFLALGGFDESLTGYGGEDTEFGMRLTRRGIPIVFNPAARAETVEAKTMDQGLAELRRYAATNLRTIRDRNRDMPAPFWIDRLGSGRWRDRMFRACLNPVSDALVDVALPRSPWAIQRQLINYKVIRAVFQGYREGAP